MGKSKLEKRVDGLGLMVRIATACVVLLGFVMLVSYVEDKEQAEVVTVASLDAYPARTVGETIGNRVIQVDEPVPDALVAATMKDYADLEASRITKMAAALMGMGGEYEAVCSAEYKVSSSSTETSYCITWKRKPGTKVEDERAIIKSWCGQSWAECIQKMLAWKGGE